MSKEHKANILCLQETHISEGAHPDRFKLQGFHLACHDDHSKYRLGIHIRKNVSAYTIIPPTKINDTSTIVVSVGGIRIYNIYKPSNTSRVQGSLPIVSKPWVILGDFNSHNILWRYAITDEASKTLEEWKSGLKIYT